MKRAAVWTTAALAALFVFVENASPQKQVGFHPGYIISADYSPDSRILASGGLDGAVILWDASTGDKMKTLQVSEWRVDKVQFSPNGRYLAGYAMRSASIWDVETGQNKPLEHVSIVTAGAFSPDDQTFAGSGVWDQNIFIWDIETGEIRTKLSGINGFIRSIDYSPDGRLIAAGGTDGVYIWDVRTAAMTASLKNAPNAYVRQIAFLPDGRSVSVLILEKNDDAALYLGTAHLLNAESGALIRSIGGDFWRAGLSPDGRSLISENLEGEVYLWDVERGEIKAELEGKYISPLFSPDSRTAALRGAHHTGRLWDVKTGKIKAEMWDRADLNIRAFAPDGSALAAADDAIQIWNIANRRLVTEMEGHGSGIDTVAFTPDGLSIFSASSVDAPYYGRPSARLWDIKTGGLNWGMEQIESAAMSPDGTSAAISFYRAIQITDPLTGEAAAELDVYSAGAMAFSPDGKRLAFSRPASNYGEIRVWDIAADKVSKRFQSTLGRIHSIAYSPDGKTIAGGGEFETLILWDAHSGQPVKELESRAGDVYSVAFSPSGSRLASAGEDGAVRLWNLETGQTGWILEGHSGGALTVAYSPDGRTLASGGEDGTIRLWDAATGELNRTIETQSEPVSAVAFSADSRSLVSGGKNGRVLLWRLEKLPIQWSDVKRPDSPFFKNALLPNYPNPFNPETWIPFDLAKQSAVTITIYNAAGRTVRVLELGELPAGSYRAKEKAAFWDGRNSLGAPAASGVYFARIQAGGYSETRRMVLLK